MGSSHGKRLKFAEKAIAWERSDLMEIHIYLTKFLDYSIHFKGYSKITIKRYKQAVIFFCQTMGVTTFDQITEGLVTNFFYEGRVQRQWSSNTFLSYYKSLIVFFRWAKRESLLSLEPMANIAMPKLEKRLPPKLTKQQSQRLLEIVLNYPYQFTFERYRNHAIFSTFMYAGLRKSELLKLMFTDVDLENMVLFVRQGKGSKDRTIPISFTLAQTLSLYVQERKRLNKTCPEFFTSTCRNYGFNETGLNRLVKRIRRASQVDFTIHKLRHTFATLMIEGGCDIYALSRMMGHNDIKTTTIYLHASVEHLKAQINKHPLN